MSPTAPKDQQSAGPNIGAGILAAVLPGLGHIYRGEVKRGLFAGFAILSLLAGGLLIGGIDVVDSKEDVWLFRGQLLCGPIVYVIDTIHQSRFKAYGPVRRGNRPDVESLRSGYPDEKRVVGSDGKASWQRLTEAEAQAGEGPPNTKSLGKVNDIGSLFALVAGMLNLIVFLDALLPTPRKGEAEPVKGSKEDISGAEGASHA